MSRKLTAIFFAIFALGCAPILFIRPLGEFGAGFSYGFMEPLTLALFIFIAVSISFIASCLDKNTLYSVSAIFISALIVSVIAKIGSRENTGLISSALLISLVLFAKFARELDWKTVLSVTVMAFLASSELSVSPPEIACKVAYITGLIVSTFLIYGIGLSLGFSISDQIAPHFKAFIDKASATQYGSVIAKLIKR